MGHMNAGDGKAVFTAECSHVFHFICIATNVGLGHRKCPICQATWTNMNLPSHVLPVHNFHSYRQVGHNFAPQPYAFQQSLWQTPVYRASSFESADDEPLPDLQVRFTFPNFTLEQPEAEGITIKALPEYPALIQSQQSHSFAVLVGIHAPPLSQNATDRGGTRAPIDLVAVLDVSGSMSGDKIKLLMQAVNFVADNLGPNDRFSIVTFSTYAQRVTPLKRMTETGRVDLDRAINSLRADGWTNIIAGLQTAVEILERRREKNLVASIILLSDGQDNQNPPDGEGFYTALNQLPACIRSRNMDNSHNHTQNEEDIVPVAVHTFGFGSDHDARALHAVADGSGGTFSYIESIEVIQDAFAQCLGGLLSVVAQDVKIQVQTSSAGVKILSISSGRYTNTIHNNANKQCATIYVGDLYAEEEKKFLIHLMVPQETNSSATKLMEVQCCYDDLLSHENILSETKIVEIRRPLSEDLSEEDRKICLEVDRERNRVLVAEGIAQAQEMAEKGGLDRARSLLEERRHILLSSASAQTGDALSRSLDNELKEIQMQMASRVQYESTGRAYALSRRSAHMYQRATSQAVQIQQQSSIPRTSGHPQSLPSATFNSHTQAGVGYQTTFMKHMVEKSQSLRQSTKQDEEVSSSGNPNMP